MPSEVPPKDPMSASIERLQSPLSEAVAVIGMAGRFPMASNVAKLWENLRHGVECIRSYTDEELLAAGATAEMLAKPNYVRAGTSIENPEHFDARFFGLNPTEAEVTDPQQRVFLECAHEALETAGYAPQFFDGLIGVFAGAGVASYWHNNVLRNREILQSVGDLQSVIGNDKDFLPTRISYKLNLNGPSVNVQTACSTSLVAVHLACQSLLDGSCDLALAGGVSVRFPSRLGYLYQQEGILSPDGHCRAFDAKAGGTVPGTGAAVVVLRRLADAFEDGDTIDAVILGSAINNDGSRKVGYTAPSVEGQSLVIASAHAIASVDAESIGYVEAHGTGTHLGDPVEIKALTRAFRSTTQRAGYCAIGSVKTNLGHLDTAAGATGLIKTILQLKHRELAPSLHFEQPNPELDLESSPFFVNTTLRRWENGSTRLRAGVSSFGLGGTNAHVVVEEAPSPAESGPSRAWQLLAISAKTETALESATQQLKEHLAADSGNNPADVAYTLHVGRSEHPHRRFGVCDTSSDAVSILSEPETRMATGFAPDREPSLVFLFPGGGAQYPGMGRELYESEAIYRQSIDQCAALFEKHLGSDIRALLYPSGDRAAEASLALRQTLIGLPALFSTEYALAQLFLSWGARPHAVIGHSLGEYVAACVSGILSLKDAAELVAARSRLMQSLASGAMVVVPWPETRIRELLGDDLSIAAINGPSLCVVSGPTQALGEFEAKLAREQIDCNRIHIEVASHSAVVEPILEEFTSIVRRLSFGAPEIPILSNLTGTWFRASDTTDPTYWPRHLRNTVRFSDGVAELAKDPSRIFVEVGPGYTLGTLVRQHPAWLENQPVILSMPHAKDAQHGVRFLLNAVGQLWVAGARVDWRSFYRNERRRRLHLPTYPFERQRFFVEPSEPAADAGSDPVDGVRSHELKDYFYAPVWKQAIRPTPAATHAAKRECWLLFHDSAGIADRVARKLEDAGHEVIRVEPAATFDRKGEREFAIHPARGVEYEELLSTLQLEGRFPNAVVHMWSLEAPAAGEASGDSMHEALEAGLFSVLRLVQSLSAIGVEQPLRLELLTTDGYCVSGETGLQPEQSMVHGLGRIISQEFGQIRCRAIDVAVSPAASPSQIASQVFLEITSEPRDDVVVFRGRDRWLPSWERVQLQASDQASPYLRPGGVYLITGGLGGIGIELAAYLAASVRARLVLTGRSAIPERAAWDAWLLSHDANDSTSAKLLALKRLQALGAEVVVFQADVTDRSWMDEVFQRAKERFGKIDGVIHAAGLPGGGMIEVTRFEDVSNTLRPKVEGTLVLERLVRDSGADFLMLCSSLSSLLGGLGHADYCAANLFLDALAQSRRGTPGPHIVSVNWSAWQGTGMAAHYQMPEDLRSWQEEIHKHGISPAEGQQAFRRILDSGLPQVAVCTEDLARLVRESRLLTPENAKKKGGAKKRTLHARPRLEVPYAAPHTEIETAVAGIWEQLLGVAPVGINDNFFTLGGHSLLGTQLIARLHDTFGVKLSLRKLFEGPTVAAVAAAVSGRQAELDAAEQQRLMTMIEQLGEDEIDAELLKRASAAR